MTLTFPALFPGVSVISTGLDLWFYASGRPRCASLQMMNLYWKESASLFTCGSGMLRHGSPPNLHNLAKCHLKRIVLISRYQTWQTVLSRWS